MLLNASFSYKYNWLSNFYDLESPIVYQGISYYTVENFYCAMKTLDIGIRREIARSPASVAKSMGRNLELRSDWDEVKLKIMTMAIRHKFSDANPILKQKLIDTKDTYLQEANWWKDTYWGVYMKTGEGLNMLGRILMKVRKEIEIN